MTTSLDAFFDAIGPMLYGKTSPSDVEAELGTCPSGTQNLGFYAVLVERNWFKILRDMYTPLRLLVMRKDRALWDALVRAYAREHPAAHWNPNPFAAAFSEFLSHRRSTHPEQPVVYEELADFLYTRHLAFTSPQRDDDDGFDERIFVRQYSYPVHELCLALESDPDAEVGEPSTRILVIFRHAQSHVPRIAFPTIESLGALARRQGLGTVPEMFAAITPAALDAAESTLVDQGVLHPRTPANNG